VCLQAFDHPCKRDALETLNRFGQRKTRRRESAGLILHRTMSLRANGFKVSMMWPPVMRQAGDSHGSRSQSSPHGLVKLWLDLRSFQLKVPIVLNYSFAAAAHGSLPDLFKGRRKVPRIKLR
jgi:hypothetical protein